MGVGNLLGGLADKILGSGPLGTVLEKVIPDVNARREASDAIRKSITDTANEALIKQIEINLKEAEHPSLFVSGWRPAVGWICGASLLWHSFLAPLVVTIAGICGVSDLQQLAEAPPALLQTTLLGMLGLGGLRTFEKYSGNARSHWGRKGSYGKN